MNTEDDYAQWARTMAYRDKRDWVMDRLVLFGEMSLSEEAPHFRKRFKLTDPKSLHSFAQILRLKGLVRIQGDTVRRQETA